MDINFDDLMSATKTVQIKLDEDNDLVITIIVNEGESSEQVTVNLKEFVMGLRAMQELYLLNTEEKE